MRVWLLKTLLLPSIRPEKTFPDWLVSGRLLLLSETGLKEIYKNVLAWLPIDCVEDTNLFANTCKLLVEAVVKL